MCEPYTCLMSIYKNDDPAQLRTSIESIVEQTVKPDEFLILVDGEISPQLDQVLADYSEAYPSLFKIVRFKENRGLHAVMRDGVEMAKYSLIMRMDADDFSRCDRAELQLAEFENDDQLMFVGSNAYEFVDTPFNVVAKVVLPEGNDEIVKFAKRRNPFRHDAVIYRKEAVLDVGNYDDVPYFEDYDLFLRMLHFGHKAKNVQQPLLSVRVSEDFYGRRGGVQYLKKTIYFLKKCKREHLIGPIDRAITLVPRAVVCLIPGKIRDLVYRKMLR